MNITKHTIEQLNGNFAYWFGDNNANEVSINNATELHLMWEDDKGFGSRKTIKATKKELTFDYIMSKINNDKTFVDFTTYFNKLINKYGLSAYPTSYGIGIFVAVGNRSDIANKKTEVEKLLNKFKINYKTEYSDAGWVFRYKISKTSDNLSIIKKLK